MGAETSVRVAPGRSAARVLACARVSDEAPDRLTPVSARSATGLLAWAVAVSLLYLAVKELGLRLVR